MDRVCGPLDKEWNRLNALQTEFRHHSERLPPEQFAIRSCAGTIARAEELVAGIAGLLRNRVYVGRYGCPGNQSRRRELSYINLKVEGRLVWIGRDDFKVLASAERDQGVSSTDSRMASAGFGSNSRLPLDPCYCALEIGRAEQQMIDSAPGGYQVFSQAHITSGQD